MNEKLKIIQINKTHWMLNRVTIRQSKNPNKYGWYINKDDSKIFSFQDAIKKAVRKSFGKEYINKELIHQVIRSVRSQKTNSIDFNYSQVCVIHGLLIEDHLEFEKAISSEMKGARIKFLECIKTGPDKDSNGIPIPDTGGRSDVFFYIHSNDISYFAIGRLRIEGRWIEDVLSDLNYHSNIYPTRVYDYVTWNEEYISFFKKVE